jgi:coenzyme F420-0:L-glutamate ligase / coenzyme F420-1:gamma-L-glutamate ligase
VGSRKAGYGIVFAEDSGASMPETHPESYAALLALMRERRSIRRFKAEALPEGTLERLMEAARWAPSASNRQPFRFMAIEQAETRARMAELVRAAVRATVERLPERDRGPAAAYAEDFVRFETAPLVLVAYFRASNALAERLGMPPERDLGAISSVSAAIMNLLLAVHALGLGACWMTGPLLAAAELESYLGIPSGSRLAAVIPVGVADECPSAPTRRSSSHLLVRFGGST